MARTIRRPDYILLFSTACLILLGGLVLVSVSLAMSEGKMASPFHYLNHQILYGLLPGAILAFILFKIDLSILKRFALLFLLINIVLLIMVFLPHIGINFRGASRWIRVGPFSFQPSELLKLSFVLYLSSWLASRYEKIKRDNNFLKTFLPFLIIIGAIGLFLLLQPDMSTFLIIISTAAIMYFLAETPLWHSILLMVIIAIGSIILIMVAPYRFNRVRVLFNPELDPMGIGYQVKQASIAIGSGGVFGSGLGLSQRRFGFVPHSISDSTFAIFAKETGFFGSMILIFLYMIFFWRGIKISRESLDKFSRFCAFGITIWIILQSFVNIGSMAGIMPLMGVPLPFISYGGSALISELAGVGILLNISKTI